MTESYLDILAKTIRKNWDQPALTDFYLTGDGSAQDTSRGNHYTYGEMYVEIVRVADMLTSLGLHKGDHIAICGTNSAHWAIAYLAIAKMQGVSVTVMYSLQPDEIARLIDFSDAKALFVDRELWSELKDRSLPQVERVIVLDNWDVLRGEGNQISNLQSPISNLDVRFEQLDPDSLAMICFTSGTTGVPKGVMLSYYSVGEHISVAFKLYPVESHSSYVSFMPFAHTAGLVGDVLAHVVNGKHINIAKEIVGVDTIYSMIKILHPYMFIAVPELITSLYKSKGNAAILLLAQNCKLIIMGMAKWNDSIEKILEKIDVPVCTGYSQTEAGASICLTPYNQYKKGASGKVVEGYEMKISFSGEILVKGENVMLGYYKDPEATAAKIDKDGWLHTGDKGHLDEDGYLYVEGRLEQDIIVLPNGENIRPDNIESLINALPEVKESIVFARDGKLVAIVVPQITNHPYGASRSEESQITNTDLRRKILRSVNPQLPLFSQLYDVEITDQPLARTEKQTLKRYLYK